MSKKKTGIVGLAAAALLLAAPATAQADPIRDTFNLVWEGLKEGATALVDSVEFNLEVDKQHVTVGAGLVGVGGEGSFYWFKTACIVTAPVPFVGGLVCGLVEDEE